MSRSMYTAKEIKNLYSITNQTLYNWRKSNKIEFVKLPSGSYLYYLIDLDESSTKHTESKSVIYARVSNTKQANDLQNQIQTISNYMVSNGQKVSHIYQDIASGMNDDRKGLNDLIDDIIKGDIDTVYISYKDRLTRFGYGYLENMFSKFGTKIEVLNATREEDFQQELTDDLISIIHHFSMKMYSSRRKALKQLKKDLSSDDIT